MTEQIKEDPVTEILEELSATNLNLKKALDSLSSQEIDTASGIIRYIIGRVDRLAGRIMELDTTPKESNNEDDSNRPRRDNRDSDSGVRPSQ